MERGRGALPIPARRRGRAGGRLSQGAGRRPRWERPHILLTPSQNTIASLNPSRLHGYLVLQPAHSGTQPKSVYSVSDQYKLAVFPTRYTLAYMHVHEAWYSLHDMDLWQEIEGISMQNGEYTSMQHGTKFLSMGFRSAASAWSPGRGKACLVRESKWEECRKMAFLPRAKRARRTRGETGCRPGEVIGRGCVGPPETGRWTSARAARKGQQGEPCAGRQGPSEALCLPRGDLYGRFAPITGVTVFAA